MARLGDICKFQSGGTPSKSNPNFFGGNIPWITTVALNGGIIDSTNAVDWITDKAIQESAAKIVPQNSIMVGTRVGIGKVAINAVPMSTSQDIISLLDIDTASWDKVFLCKFIIGKNDFLLSQARGATIKGIKIDSLSNLQVPDIPLEEQRRIAALLDKVSDLIAKRRAQLDKLDLLVKSRFVEMFGDPILNQKGFPCYTVGDIITFQGGSQPDKKYFEYIPTDKNIRLIQIRDYKSDKFITYIPKAMAKRFCCADDIMIGRYGPPIFQILQGIEGAYNVALMKAVPQRGNKEFIRQFLKQDCLLEYLEGLSKRTAGQDGIQMDKLKAYPFPFPPMELQKKFECFVEEVDKFKSTIQLSLDKLEMLKKSLIQQYFG